MWIRLQPPPGTCLGGMSYFNIANANSLCNTGGMIIGDRLRLLRETKKLSQGDIEKRTGLLRCYISRVENGHTVPAIETLEKMARAMEVPLYQLFYEGEEPPELPNLPKRKSADDIAWGSTGKEARFLGRLRRTLGQLDEADRRLLLHMAQKMSAR
jgi:transcriptional regulator with XRE-family HTH domain